MQSDRPDAWELSPASGRSFIRLMLVFAARFALAAVGLLCLFGAFLAFCFLCCVPLPPPSVTRSAPLCPPDQPDLSNTMDRLASERERQEYLGTASQ